MKLEGSLDAFSLPDIFQLLSYTKKTGGLRLAHEGARGVVYFTDGSVTGASAEGARQTLARRLVGAGLLGDDAVAHAVTSAVAAGSTANGGGVVAELLRNGAVSADAVAAVAFDQVHDAVFELLRWPSGDFALAVDETNPDDVGLRLAPDEVVTRAGEQRTRWEAAAAVVPSPDAVVELCGSADPELVVRAPDWAVLRLVDGRRRVAEIVDLSGTGQFSTVVTLADLVTRGLVQVRSADGTDLVGDLARRMALLAPAEGDDAVAEPVAPPVVQPVAEAVVTPLVEQPVATPVAPTPVEPAVEHPTAVIEAPVETPLEVDVSSTRPAAEHVEAPAASTVVTVADPAPQDLPPAADPGPTASQPRLGGPHVPGDVVPPRVEPFLGSRQPQFSEAVPGMRSPSAPRAGGGSAALATAPAGDALIERDPSVNRSLLLRLIAGVRGL